MDAPQLEAAFQQGELLLDNATAISQQQGMEAEPVLRIDDAIPQGICRASREQKASLIVLGWGQRTGLRARLFGNVIDSVLAEAHCPVAVSRLVSSPTQMRCILVPLENLTSQALRKVKFAHRIAAATGASVTVLHICPPNSLDAIATGATIC